MIIQRPIQHLYPSEAGTTDEEPNNSVDYTHDLAQEETSRGSTTNSDTIRPHR